MEWQGEYLVNHIVQTVTESSIADIFLVLGCCKSLIETKIKARKIHILDNPDWQSGMSSSIKCGISSLPEDIVATFIILLDQPFIKASLLDEMIYLFHQSGAKIIAPRIGDQQSNPVLFSRNIFPELMQISGDKGAKALLKKHDVKWLDWQDANLLLDIDSEADYKEARKKLNN